MINFIVPVHPWLPQVILEATQYAITLTKSWHKEILKVFTEYQLVYCGLIQQVLEAIQPKFQQVPTHIYQLFMILFTIYGKISAKKLRTKYDDTTTIFYNIIDPIDIMFNAINYLREMGELTGRLYTPIQCST